MCSCSLFCQLFASFEIIGPVLVVRVFVSVHALDLVGGLMHDAMSYPYHHFPHCVPTTDHIGFHHLHSLHHELGEVVVPLHSTLQAVALLVGCAIPLARGL